MVNYLIGPIEKRFLIIFKNFKKTHESWEPLFCLYTFCFVIEKRKNCKHCQLFFFIGNVNKNSLTRRGVE